MIGMDFNQKEGYPMNYFRKLTAALCTVCLLLACCVCAGAERAPADYTGKVVNMFLSDEGYFSITRQKAKNEPMGEENSWTIFVYLCGSDLSDCAADDFYEMVEGSKDSRVRFVVLAGGSLEWPNDLIGTSALEIYLIENGIPTQITQTDKYYYMNDPDTLYAFLSWGIANYPADKMGLVMWDHGGGCVTGVCIDRIYERDEDAGVIEDTSKYNFTMTLPMISDALSRVYDEMTDQFEFIGYDACLMGTMESAFMLSSYARYMIASEELEPGLGWNYTAIGQAIGATGEIDGAGLGKIACESFFESCEADGRDANVTLSCIDLRLMDKLALAFDTFSIRLLNASRDYVTRNAIMKRMNRVDFFGSNSESEGYNNLIDLGEFVTTLSSIVDQSEEVLEAINEAVVCSINGIYHEDACGLSVYYPLYMAPGSAELGKYAAIACSPYYYGYVAENAYASANSGISGYDLNQSLNAWSSTMDPDAETIVEYYGIEEDSEPNDFVEFYDEPQLLEDGTFGFSLTDQSLEYISSVNADIYFLSDDGENLIQLGSTDDVNANWETGVFLDNFDGLWFCLPDGQLISATVVSEEENYTIYTTPVLLNGEESNLRFVVDYTDYSVNLASVCSGVDAYGLAGRTSYVLKDGDVIVPIFNAFSLDSDDVFCYYGSEYIYDGSTEWSYTYLFDSIYYYQFTITDMFGGSTSTDGVFFTVEDGEIHFDQNT